MSTGSPVIQDLSIRLLQLYPRQIHDAWIFQNALSVFTQMKASLSPFTGSAGYASLVSRSFALALAKEPLLAFFELEDDGTLMQSVCLMALG